MSWRETCVMDERMKFIVASLEGDDSFAAVCRRFGISRQTGYKWKRRFERDGVAGLSDRSRAPVHHPQAICAAVIERVLAVRIAHPTWGPRKVKAWLERHDPKRVWPAASTMGLAFDRAGLTRCRKRRRRVAPHDGPFAICRRANDTWCIDFKGWFLTGDGTRVDPLTISDAHSRYLIRCQAVGRPDFGHVWPVIDAALRDYGLPRAMRSDNGPPFASLAAGGLSRLAVRLIKAGVRPERIAPGKPQQNGRHERLHLTLKQDTASPPARSLRDQMARFAAFLESYNTERPHEALGQTPPAAHYQPSPRRYDGVLRSPDYPDEAQVRRVRSNGEIKWRGHKIFISETLVGEPVGLFHSADNTWSVNYGPIFLGTLEGEEKLRRPWSGSRSGPRQQRRTKTETCHPSLRSKT